MNNNSHRPPANTIYDKLHRYARRIALHQCLLWLLMVSLFAIFAGKAAALSAFYAGGICTFCNSYFAFKVFKTTGASHSRQIMGSFYWGEAIKLLTAAILFAIVMKYGNIHPVAFFVTLVIFQLGFFMSMLLQKSPLKE